MRAGILILITAFATSCASNSAGVFFSEEQCRWLREQRGVNTTLLCGQPPENARTPQGTAK